mgnify:CR=1 FL=1
MDNQPTDLINAVYKTAIHFDFPIAIWRLPNQENVCIVISTKYTVEEKHFSTIEHQKGFCFQKVF